MVRDIKGKPAYLVDTVEEIDLEWFVDTQRVGITAGASTPARVTREVIEFRGGLRAGDLGPPAFGMGAAARTRNPSFGPFPLRGRGKVRMGVSG